MNKVFQDLNTSNIISTNKVNTVITNTDNKIESDSEFREVVKKGYLLNQINLSSIPTIIQDALDKLINDAKNATLSDSLIQNLKQSLESLDDGIYKKTYIDNTITYLEDLLTSKVNLETVASITDNKIAEATENLVTTATAELLTSRLGNSETEITNVKQLINTKDTARANQIIDLLASINDTFAGYSEAIDLFVDDNGNVKSQKIETLTTNIGLQLQEVNQLIADTNNEWNAKSIKFITSPSGAITGYSFQDGSGLKSNFNINADNFNISNSTNTYTPFSIIDNNIVFNGKVSFSNTINSNGVALPDILDGLQNDLTAIISENNTSTLLAIANLDGKIDTKEAELISSINAEAQARIDAIALRVQEIANLDGKITAEEQNRIDAINEVSSAYKSYISIVNKSLADGILTPEEEALIADAQINVDLAKARFLNLENNITTISNEISSINTELSSKTLAIANLDGKIDTKEAELISSINAEAQARIDAIALRVQEIANLDRKITAEEQNRIDAINEVSSAYKSYTDTVKQALIDGEITDVEVSAIAEAQNRVNIAKEQLEIQINNLTKVEDISWQQEVQNAINNNATYVDGSKVVTNQALVNNLNATGGIIAETVTANEFVGKTFTGAVINGAVINGSVVKASYLDLDGQLEVLTNYHITPAMYNANPSLYTDAVYISGSNEYRIPSISNITTLQKENASSGSPWVPAGSYVLNSGIYSYATANVNSNIKAVKDKPTNIYISASTGSAFLPANNLYSASFATLTAGSGYFRLYIGNLLILNVVKSGSSVSYSGVAGNGSIISPAYNNTNTVTLTYGGLTLSISRTTFYGDGLRVVYGGATNLKILDSWTSGQIRVEANSISENGANTLIGFRLPAITINNMI